MKLTDRLKAIGISNTYAIVADGHPFIWRYVKWCGRDVRPSGWRLSIKGKEEQHVCHEHSGRNWRTDVEPLLTKCRQLYPHMQMVKGPWPNTYVPKVDLDAAVERLKQKR